MTLSRRDFLKLASTLTVSAYLSPSLPAWLNPVGAGRKILILLFDAMSARHLSLHGYPRETSPEINRFAERATVYHSHYSTANFTSPSTGSLFLGMYPWKHRAHNGNGLVRRDLVKQNLFAQLGEDFYRFAFAQTEYANILMNQFAGSIERNLPAGAYSLNFSQPREKRLPGQDFFDAFAQETLFDNYLNIAKQLRTGGHFITDYPEYPLGVPVIADNDVAFQLEDVFDGVFQEVRNAATGSRPHFSYHHLFAPHNPYRPQQRYLELFQDDYKPVRKPNHPLSTKSMVYRNIIEYQRTYDQYIAHVDHEFGVLMKKLENDGLLQDTYVIVTSDHGELFERSTTEHAVPFLFESVIRIPLLIRAPGQAERRDIHAPTSNIDLYPTVLSLLDKAIPSDVDGRLLPGFGGEEDPTRSLYAMFSPKSSAFAPLQKGTFALLQGQHKLIYYKGYEEYPEAFELYDLREDPDELDDLFERDRVTANQMKAQLLNALEDADAPYR